MADFLDNYREIFKGKPTIITKTSPEKVEESVSTNDLVFRNANEGEKIGLQKVVFLDNDYNPHTLYMKVPERESVGYGNIVGWGSPDSQNWKTIKDISGKGVPKFPLLTIPMAVGVDLLAGNSINNNAKKQNLSKYTGENKAVGVGEAGESQGNIFGFIDENGVEYDAKSARELFNNPTEFGYIGIAGTEGIEKPEMVQEHQGPDYVPGDIILGALGLRPNRGAVGFTFKEPEDHRDYQQFIRKIRDLRGR